MRRAVSAILATIAALVMLLSFKTHLAVPATAAPPAAVSGTTSSPATPGPTSSPTGSGSSSSGTTKTTSAKKVTGDAVNTRFGNVQVRITVTNGRLTAVTAIDYPQNNPRDQQINSYAIPALDQETLRAGNAHIDTISGATYTSDGYITSLQSALDKANL